MKSKVSPKQNGAQQGGLEKRGKRNPKKKKQDTRTRAFQQDIKVVSRVWGVAKKQRKAALVKKKKKNRTCARGKSFRGEPCFEREEKGGKENGHQDRKDKDLIAKSAMG